jgi:hypothetical protein
MTSDRVEASTSRNRRSVSSAAGYVRYSRGKPALQDSIDDEHLVVVDLDAESAAVGTHGPRRGRLWPRATGGSEVQPGHSRPLGKDVDERDGVLIVTAMLVRIRTHRPPSTLGEIIV